LPEVASDFKQVALEYRGPLSPLHKDLDLLKILKKKPTLPGGDYIYLNIGNGGT
jgi:hypothetical protein